MSSPGPEVQPAVTETWLPWLSFLWLPFGALMGWLWRILSGKAERSEVEALKTSLEHRLDESRAHADTALAAIERRITEAQRVYHEETTRQLGQMNEHVRMLIEHQLKEGSRR